ncbi:hypothetical protein KIL84_014047 [Mauremys mutica]|uniref:Uncharacterized protein n=1 Tax=Mauremys mutica TaxID=74926 RepID=A0A9D3WYJ7_9SAUR|nr:hypothetical protein KIL84_014047 [Mauremys mutica]
MVLIVPSEHTHQHSGLAPTIDNTGSASPTLTMLRFHHRCAWHHHTRPMVTHQTKSPEVGVDRYYHCHKHRGRSSERGGTRCSLAACREEPLWPTPLPSIMHPLDQEAISDSASSPKLVLD